MRKEVFISYSSADRQVADAICTALEGCGISCWIAPRDVVPGASYGGALVDAINQADLVVLILSSQSNYSQQVAREIESAAAGEKPIIPFRIQNVTPSKQLEFFISASHWLDALTGPLKDHLEALNSAVRTMLESSRKCSNSAHSETYTVYMPEGPEADWSTEPAETPRVSRWDCTPLGEADLSKKLILRVEATDDVSVADGESQPHRAPDTPSYCTCTIVGRKKAYTIGRLADNDVVLDDGLVSRYHAFIYFSEGRFIIVDGALQSDGTIKRSTNGIIIDGQPRLQAALSPGSTISIGKHKITCVDQ